ncbi:Clp protease proteolytic subunit ClpP [Burkholderia arboris]|uniref:Clp protease proteolytic subunit ClpP n=1 Tax=Burkholderia arboris TaxID=488730 RepID=A0A9Q9UTB3_9BURK|nr:Clp protease proteolytic subunit ClpP [Burkholderia arboris]
METMTPDTAWDFRLSAEGVAKYRPAIKIVSSEPEIDKRIANR